MISETMIIKSMLELLIDDFAVVVFTISVVVFSGVELGFEGWVAFVDCVKGVVFLLVEEIIWEGVDSKSLETHWSLNHNGTVNR